MEIPNWISYLFAPIAGWIMYILKKQQTHELEQDRRLTKLELKTSITDTVVKRIEADIKEIKEGVKELVNRHI